MHAQDPHAETPTRIHARLLNRALTHARTHTHRRISNSSRFSKTTMISERASILRYAYIACLVIFCIVPHSLFFFSDTNVIVHTFLVLYILSLQTCVKWLLYFKAFIPFFSAVTCDILRSLSCFCEWPLDY